MNESARSPEEAEILRMKSITKPSLPPNSQFPKTSTIILVYSRSCSCSGSICTGTEPKGEEKSARGGERAADLSLTGVEVAVRDAE